MTRRGLLGAMGLAVVAAPLPRLLAWAKSPVKPGGGGWATGGTAAMTGARGYPNPFTSRLGAACKLTCAQIVGPCHGATQVRQDISEGHPGLPVRLAFQVLDLSTQALYNTRGARDTRNADDKVTAPDQRKDFVLQTRKMPDGALLAWKTFIVRSSTGLPLCNANSEHIQALLESGVDPANPDTFPAAIRPPKPPGR